LFADDHYCGVQEVAGNEGKGASSMPCLKTDLVLRASEMALVVDAAWARMVPLASRHRMEFPIPDTTAIATFRKSDQRAEAEWR
jgi:hypothetical protein